MNPEENKNELEWSAPEYENKSRSVDWYWAVGIIVVCGSVAAVIFKDPLFAIFLVLGAGILVYFSFRPAEMVSYKISRSGISIDEKEYHYEHIKSFWIAQPPHPKKLLLAVDKPFSPMLVIPIDHLSEDDLARILNEKGLEEKKLEEPFAHRIMDKLGF